MGRDEETGCRVEQRNETTTHIIYRKIRSSSALLRELKDLPSFQFLCSTSGPFLRPDLPAATTPRAAAVKAGRRAGGAALSAVARPRLDGGEHGVKLAAELGTSGRTRALITAGNVTRKEKTSDHKT